MRRSWRGLSLARLQHRLADSGTPVSVATLSYWQSGRSQPERLDSFHAVVGLEDVLGLPAGGLSRLLDTPRPQDLHHGPKTPANIRP